MLSNSREFLKISVVDTGLWVIHAGRVRVSLKVGPKQTQHLRRGQLSRQPKSLDEQCQDRALPHSPLVQFHQASSTSRLIF